MIRASLVVVLVEDQQQQRFVRRYLYRLGYSERDIRFAPIPAGRGSGEQFVRENYAGEVREYRLRAAKAQSALVVVIDADKCSIALRHQQLAQELAKTELGSRSESERIAHWIPRRAIETWILCLSGDRVDEETDYRQELIEGSVVKDAAERFFDWTRNGYRTPDHCVRSLEEAIPEARRIER